MLDDLRAIEPQDPAAVFLLLTAFDHEEVHDHQVVQHHPADDQADQHQVDAADCAVDRVGGQRRRLVGVADSELAVRVPVALTAGGHQVDRVDGRGRVHGRQHPVGGMAIDAGGGGPIPTPRHPAVIAVYVGADHAALQVVLGDDHRVVVAGPARLGRLVLGERSGIGVAVREDEVLSVAAGARRAVVNPRLQRPPVNRTVVLKLDVGVTLPAGPRNVPRVDARGRVGRAPEIMNAMAVGARGRDGDAALGALPVNRLGVSDERLRELDDLIGQQPRRAVALGAGSRQAHLVRFRPWVAAPKDVMRAMTAGTGGRPRVAPAQRVAVQALRIRPLDLTVAGAAAR